MSLSQRSGHLLAGVALAALMSGCPKPNKTHRHQGEGARRFQPEKVIQATKKKLQGLEGREDCERAPVLRDLGLLQLLYQGRSASATRALKGAWKSGKDPWAAFALGLRSEAKRRRREAVGWYLEAVFGALEQRQNECKVQAPLPRSRCSLQGVAAKRIGRLLEEDTLVKGIEGKLVRAHRESRCPHARHVLGSVLRKLARRSGRWKRLMELSKAGGCLPRWEVSPRFGGFGGLDLDDPTLKAPASKTRSWRTNSCKMVLYSEDGLHGLKEVRFLFKLKKKSSALVWVDAGGRDFTLAVDDETVKKSTPRHEWVTRRSAYPVDLEAGIHEGVIRFPVSLGRYHAQVRLTTRTGRPLDATFESERDAGGDLKTAGAQKGSPLPMLARPKRPLRPFYDFLQVEWALRHGRPDVGRRHLTRLVRDAPNFVEGRLLAARAEIQWPVAGVSLARDLAVGHLSSALSVDEGALEALVRRLRLSWRAGRYQEALNLAKRGRDARDLAVWESYRAKVLQDKGWLVLAESAAEEATGIAPTSRLAWKTRLSLARQRNDFRDIETATKRLLALDRSSDVWVRLLVEKGDNPEALREYRRLLKMDPHSRDLREGLAAVLAATRALKESEAIYRDLLSLEGWNPDLRLSLAEVFLEREKTDEAKSVLLKGRQLKPSSDEMRKALGGLGVKSVVEAHRVSGIDHINRYKKSPFKGADKKSAVYVLDRTVDWILPSGGLVEITHQIIHLRSSAHVKHWGQVSIPDGVDALTVRTVKADGRVLEPELPSGSEPLHLPNLDVGDFVEVETMVTRPPLAELAGGFMGRRFYFQNFDGVMRRSEYLVITPRDMDVLVDRRGEAPPMRVSAGPKVIVRSWVAQNTDRLRRQPHSPPPMARVASVRVAARVTWKKLAKMIDAKQRLLDRPSYEMTVLAKRLCSKGTRAERARRVYRWVSNNVEQGGSFYDPARKALARRRGYRLTLVRAMLRLCRVPVDTVMVEPIHRSVPRGRVPRVPDLSSFKYPVLRAKVGGAQELHLFPFIKSIPAGFLPSMLRGGQAIQVTGGSYGFLQMPKKVGRDRREVVMKVELGPRGIAKVNVVERLYGWPAVMWRRNLERMRRRRFLQGFQQGRLAPNFPGAELRGGLQIRNVVKWEKPLEIEYAFKVDDFARYVSGRLVLRRAFFAQRLASTYLTRAKRKAPLLFGSHPEFELKISVRLPKGFSAEMVSPNAEVKGPYGRVSRTVKKERRKDGRRYLHVEIQRRLPFTRVPLSSYADFGRFARRADGLEEIVAVFKK